MSKPYQANSRLSRNEWITDPTVPDPKNLPDPASWLLAIRPYPVKEETIGGIIMPQEHIDFTNYLTNVGRVIKVGPCTWTKTEHYNKQGEQFDWVKPGDFVSYAANTGMKRTFKGVSYLLLMDDEVLEILRDPKVFSDDSTGMQMDIPQDHLEKYNTIYNPQFKEGKE